MAERPALDEAKRGSAELLILALVGDEALHGYEVGARIERQSNGTVTFTLAALYATLYRLEARRWISGRWVEKAGQRRRRHYRITEAGRKGLAPPRRGREGRPAAAPALPDPRGRPEGPRLAARGLGPIRDGARPGGRRPLRLSG